MVTLTCPEPLGTFDIVVPGGGVFTPGVTVKGQVFIQYVVTGTVTVGGQVVFNINDVQNAPAPAGAVSCDFVATFSTETGETATVSGTVLGVLRGAPA